MIDTDVVIPSSYNSLLMAMSILIAICAPFVALNLAGTYHGGPRPGAPLVKRKRWQSGLGNRR